MDRKDFWYRNGLQFECTQCGDCCTGAPGYVWVSESEIFRLSETLGLSVAKFGAQYLRYVKGRYSLTEKSNGDCVFWNSEKGCQVYEGRPDQCRSWPFWHDNLMSEERWNATAEHCPGCNQGHHCDLIKIQNHLALAPDRENWPD